MAFVANKAHWTEVGGMNPGSFTTNSTEIFQEGLQFPNVKLFRRGVVNQSLLDILASNVRLPDLTLGDLWAGIAAIRRPTPDVGIVGDENVSGINVTGPMLLEHRQHRRVERAQWSLWEGSTASLLPDEERVRHFAEDEFADAIARIECHYFVNGGFFDSDDHLLRRADRIRDIPGVIVQGRYDMLTPVTTAWDLHKAWPRADFRLVLDAGHAQSEPGIVHELISATDGFRDP